MVPSLPTNAGGRVEALLMIGKSVLKMSKAGLDPSRSMLVSW